MWRDPLDDLIEGLERVVPQSTASIGPTMAEEQGHFVDIQILMSALIYARSDAELAANEQYQEASRRLDAFRAKYGRF